jgi:hypothetical protein
MVALMEKQRQQKFFFRVTDLLLNMNSTEDVEIDLSTNV